MNDIHRWGENDHHPLVRIFLTRATGLGCAAVELSFAAKAGFDLCVVSAKAAVVFAAKVGHFAFPGSESLAKHAVKPLHEEVIQQTFHRFRNLIAGMISTVCVGILFSPELNFRNHLYLGLAEDDLAVKKEREMAAKIAAEATLSEVARVREERYLHFVQQRDAKRREEAERNRFDSRLANLLA